VKQKNETCYVVNSSPGSAKHADAEQWLATPSCIDAAQNGVVAAFAPTNRVVFTDWFTCTRARMILGVENPIILIS
jgi:hypothetical protein